MLLCIDVHAPAEQKGLIGECCHDGAIRHNLESLATRLCTVQEQSWTLELLLDKTMQRLHDFSVGRRPMSVLPSFQKQALASSQDEVVTHLSARMLRLA